MTQIACCSYTDPLNATLTHSMQAVDVLAHKWMTKAEVRQSPLPSPAVLRTLIVNSTIPAPSPLPTIYYLLPTTIPIAYFILVEYFNPIVVFLYLTTD